MRSMTGEGLASAAHLQQSDTMRELTFKTQAQARSLRRDQTDAERKLWNALRNRRLEGYKFLRQVPVEPYIADFLCREHRLIIEVDGATHAADREVAHDLRRTDFLASKGYRILRVSNVDVHRDLDKVCHAILLALKSPHPPFGHPLPPAGEG